MQTRNGFSLLEMLICVSLVLIFASFAVPRFSSATKTAQEAKVQADIRTISNAAALYEIDHGVFPASIDDLVTKDSDGKQYLQFKPLTPDKGEYQIAFFVRCGVGPGREGLSLWSGLNCSSGMARPQAVRPGSATPISGAAGLLTLPSWPWPWATAWPDMPA